MLAIHVDQIKEHVGLPGLRDRALLESALARPVNLLQYEAGADLCALAASCGFVDGNNRLAFQAMYVFLGLNGLRIQSDEPEVVRMVLALAAREIDEGGVAVWLREHTVER